MTPEAAPRTAAGRQLLDDIFNLDSGGFPMDPGAAILAIEAEAAAGTALDVEAILDYFLPFIEGDFAPGKQERIDQRLAAARFLYARLAGVDSK